MVTELSESLATLNGQSAEAIGNSLADANLNEEEQLRLSGKAEQFVAEIKAFSAKLISKLAKVHQLIGKFLRTNEIVLEPSDKTCDLEQYVKEMLPTKDEGGVIDWRDDDILGWAKDRKIQPRTEKLTQTVCRFQENMTHRQIIAEAEQHSIYKRHNIRDGIALVAKLIKAGEIEERGKGVIIYLDDNYNGNSCRLHVWRDGDGELNVRVNEVPPDDEWGAGDGAVFS